jgi:hypothetical protein
MAIDNDFFTQVIGSVIVIVLIIAVTYPILNIALDFVGNAFCAETVNLRSIFSNMFLGSFGRWLIPNWIFDLIPLMCSVNLEVATVNIEEVLADEIMNCWSMYGAGDLDGAFPNGNLLCSVVVYEEELDSNEGVDLMQVYSNIINNTGFDDSLSYDNVELDYSNSFRFCLRPEYQVNVFTQMAGLLYDGVGVCTGEISDSEVLELDTCTSAININDFYEWNLEIINSNISNSCFSFQEAALNNWQFNMSHPSSFSDILGLSDLHVLCNELCNRNCEAMGIEYYEYLNCTSSCGSNCYTQCDRQECVVDYEINEENTGLFDFNNDVGGLFRPESMEPYSTTLGRGVFYIRYYDYADWLQQFKVDNWHHFPECDNNIILLSNFLGEGGQSFSISQAGIEKKHDYVSICYLPYIPEEIAYPEYFQEISMNVVRVVE